MENKYKFSFGYLALKMLGKTLYSNPLAAISELIANGFDANAKSVWVYLNIVNKQKSEIIVMDNGCGMNDSNVISDYLQVGKENRQEEDQIMMGRKGIGKLAAFYLSNTYYLCTKTKTEENVYEIDFSKHESGNRMPEDDTYMRKIETIDFENKKIYDDFETGTALILKNVNFIGYGEKTFSVFESELSQLFSFNSSNRKIFFKIISDDDSISSDFIEAKKRIAFKNMSKILYNLEDKDFKPVIDLNGNEIINTEKKDDETKIKISVERHIKSPRLAIVGGKEVKLEPKGWIGIHHTIDRKKAHSNDSENFIDSRFYRFNKVRIYVRGKLALENILPSVHNTQYYVNYIEGEIHCDELDLNNFPDIAASSRQDLDKNDDRFIALVEYVKELVNELVNFKNEQTKNDEKRHREKQHNALDSLSKDVESILVKKEGRAIERSDIDRIKHSISNSFENVGNLVKTKYKIFLSHKSEDKCVSDFIYNYLITICNFKPEMIFYSSVDGGISEKIKSLEKQINEIITSVNTYAIFCIESEEFKKSEYCMFEGGAAWAVKQQDLIGLAYNDYDELVPTYLKTMNNIKIDFKNPVLNRNLYVSIVKFLNFIIEYLNRNYEKEENKKKIIGEIQIPDSCELKKIEKKEEDYYNKDVKEYWEHYVNKR